MEEFRNRFTINCQIITLQDAIKIISTSLQQDVKSISELPMYMLNRIMMLDCNSRRFPKSILEASNETQIPNIASFFSFGIPMEIETQQDTVHPMDIFLFLFIQCHPIFRQIFTTHVSKCQLSLPLIVSYPSAQDPTFYLFAYKTLFKDYIKPDNTSTSFSVTEERLPIISFMRVGTCRKSQKSEILNQIIGIPNYFFNRNQIGNTKKRYFLNGTVEIAWLFPIDRSGQEQDSYSEPSVILNLRGDAFNYLSQVQFLMAISSLVYIFVPANHCNQSFSDQIVALVENNISSKTVYLLYEGDGLSSPIGPDEIRYPECFKENDGSIIILRKDSLGVDCKIISDSLFYKLQVQTCKTSFNECASTAKKLSFKMDIDEFNIIKCEGIAKSFIDILLNPNNETEEDLFRPLAAVKKDLLPLQSVSWSKWAEAKRKLHKFELQECSDFREHKDLAEKEMNEARQTQVQILLGSSSLVNIISLWKNYGELKSDFYLIWKILQNNLNSLSKIHLPPLYDEYKKWHKLSCSSQFEINPTDNEMRERHRKINASLLNAAKDIAESSLGIEHIFRELGQIFEAYQFSQSKDRDLLESALDFRIRNLDDISASLLLEGHAFEILDGDASHVPIEWVTRVLGSLALKIGVNKKVFVLSVLGTQSTGKSTLLNTMFGADFPVSSGRCTRGIFMQLIPIAEELRSELRYDYLVLLDTEGLRAPELSINSAYKRDNELATFAVGLGDATIINMYGEGHSDVQDILQIIIYAFIRMKESSYSKPRCVFVHQNVPDAHAHTNLLTARSNLMKTLDKMTVCAAQQENQAAYYSKFCDVIQFHPDEEVFYFPGLFEGETPLQKISPAYAKKAAKLREHILRSISRQGDKKFQTVKEWTAKLESLWNSVLQENFIFSYRNGLEVKARFELDHELSCWHSDYIRAMTQWKSESINLLFNADLDEIEETWENLNSELLRERTDPTIERCSEKELMKYFFVDHEYVEIMSQWRSSVTMLFEQKREKLTYIIEKEYKMIYKMQLKKKEMDHKFSKCRKDIISKVSSLFAEMKETDQSLRDKELVEVSFQKIWNNWKSQIEVEEIERSNICKDLQRTLSESPIIKSMHVLSNRSDLLLNPTKFVEIGKHSFCRLSELNVSREHESHYFTLHNLIEKITSIGLISTIFGKRNKTEAGTNMFRSLLEIVEAECERSIEEYLLPLVRAQSPYDPNSFDIIIGNCHNILKKRNLSAQNFNSQQPMQFTIDFIFDYIFYQCCKVIPTLETIQDNFISRTNLDFKFDQLECELKEIFIELCDGIQNEHSCALKLANIIFDAMKDSLSDSVSTVYISVFLQDPKHMYAYQDRASLILRILKDLAHQRKFEDYISYINDPFNYMIIYVQRKLKEHFRIDNVMENIIRNVLESVGSLIEIYSSVSFNACTQSESTNSQMWNAFKRRFYLGIKLKTRNLSFNDLDVLDIYSIANYEQFCNFFSQAMIQKSQENDWKSWIADILEKDVSLYKNLTESLMDCKALCPFCKEPCQLSIGEHEHYCSSFHRPQGVSGWRYVESKEIVLSECTTNLKNKGKFRYNEQTYNYVDYRTVNAEFNSWKILEEDALDSKYWHWVLCTFENKFLNHYNIVKNPRIYYWQNLTEEEVVNALDKHYRDYIFRKN